MPHCRRNHPSHPPGRLHHPQWIRHPEPSSSLSSSSSSKEIVNFVTLVIHFVLSHAWRPDTPFVPVSLGNTFALAAHHVPNLSSLKPRHRLCRPFTVSTLTARSFNRSCHAMTDNQPHIFRHTLAWTTMNPQVTRSDTEDISLYVYLWYTGSRRAPLRTASSSQHHPNVTTMKSFVTTVPFCHRHHLEAVANVATTKTYHHHCASGNLRHHQNLSSSSSWSSGKWRHHGTSDKLRHHQNLLSIFIRDRQRYCHHQDLSRGSLMSFPSGNVSALPLRSYLTFQYRFHTVCILYTYM